MSPGGVAAAKVFRQDAAVWRGARFRYLETVSAQQENSAEASPRAAGTGVEVLVAPGAIVTLTNVESGKATE
jgi:hypothetical protein